MAPTIDADIERFYSREAALNPTDREFIIPIGTEGEVVLDEVFRRSKVVALQCSASLKKSITQANHSIESPHLLSP